MFKDVIAGIAASFVYDALKQPYKGIHDSAVRSRRISSAMEHGPADNLNDRQTKKPLDDLIRVIGGQRGEYTEQAAVFIRELGRSAIPDAMRNFLLCGKPPWQLFQAFDTIYKSCEPLPFSSQAAFNGLHEAMRVRVEQSTKETTLLEAIQTNSGEITRQLELVGAALERASDIRSILPAAELVELRLRIAKAVDNSTKLIHVETNQGTRKVGLNKIVIPPRLLPHTTDDLIAPQREHGEGISFVAFRRGFHRAVILGDPGGGKSTLAQFLSHTLATQILSENTSQPRLISMDLRVPLRIVLRTLESRQQRTTYYSILDYLEDELKVILDNDLRTARAFLKHILTLGQGIVVFDGLDEIMNVEDRRRMVQAVEQFINSYSACPALVTSRVVGYRDAPLSPDFEIYTLSKFNRREVQQFSEKLIAAVGSLNKKYSKERADVFVAQTETVAEDLRRNPLLLGLMVYIFMNRGDVPDNRPEIYQECALLMFEKWDKNRNIIFELPRDFNLLDLFGFLAERIFGDPTAEEGVDEAWLISAMRNFFEMWYEDRARAVAAARVLVEFITGRAWVMCEVGPKVFKFTHRTFLEYFFARRIQEESGSVEQLWRAVLLPHVVKAEWDVVGQLALQIATFRSGPKSLQALQAILQTANAHSLNAREEENFWRFVVRVIEFLLLPESKFRELTREACSRALAVGVTSSIDMIEVLRLFLARSKSRSEIVAAELRNVFVPLMKGRSGRERDFALYLSGSKQTAYTIGVGRTLKLLGHGALWEAFDDARNSIKDTQWLRADSDLHEAQTYLYLYGDRYAELYRRHGIKLLSAPGGRLQPDSMLAIGHDPVGLVVGSKALNRFSTSEFGTAQSLADAVTFVDALAHDAVEGNLRGQSIAKRERNIDAKLALDSVHRLTRLLHLDAFSDRVGKKRLLEFVAPAICIAVLTEIEQIAGGSPVERGGDDSSFVSSAREIIGRFAGRIQNAPDAQALAAWASGQIRFLAPPS